MRLILPRKSMLIEGLTIAGMIGASSIAVLLTKNKYQPEIERVWENSGQQGEEQKISLVSDQISQSE
jgi:hypothetical protein